MQEHFISVSYFVCHESQLSMADKLLLDEAKLALESSYAPYSDFHVGAAVLLSSGEIVKGSNQENCAYPSGLCAERVALFAAQASFPNDMVKTICIAAKNSDGFTSMPITPCGACRQVISEVASRQRGQAIRLLLYGASQCCIVEDATSLLPLQFSM